MVDTPVIGGECEDNICSLWQWDMGDQGPGPRLDGLGEWQDIILSRPAHDMMYRGVVTEVLLSDR